MSLLDTLRSGVKIADSVTKSIQTMVTFEKHLGDDGYGGDTFAPPAQLPAICDWKQSQLRTPQGELTVSRVSVLFLNVEDVARVTNGEGVDDSDRITLPDGTTGPILDMSGFIDAGTGQPLATEVFLG